MTFDELSKEDQEDFFMQMWESYDNLQDAVEEILQLKIKHEPELVSEWIAEYLSTKAIGEQ